MTKKIINNQLWIEQKADVYRLGITNAGQEDFGNITFAMFPKVDSVLEIGDTIVELEAEKAVTELVTPLGGKVMSINTAAQNDSSVLDNQDEALAWLIELTDVDDAAFESLS